MQRILVLQLARLGDIYQTWPVLRAIKRSMPDCELHFLTRAAFAVAAPPEGVIDRHWTLDSRSILTPVIDEVPNLDESLARLTKFTDDLAAAGFDRVINLSFSPFSSYLANAISTETTEVRGYTRTSDGFLAIPDDGSAYFYAQVGPEKANRVHVTDLFAHVAGIELTPEDWQTPTAVGGSTDVVRTVGKGAIVVHIGASHLGKTLSWSKWLQVIKGLCETHTDGRVVVVGSAEERELADSACAVTTENPPLNLAGCTTLPELFEIIRGASCLVGGDSAPVHIATLTGTPVLNLSLPQVSFWETGPRSPGSRILRMQNEDEFAAEQIVSEALRLVRGQGPALPVIRVPARNTPYLETRPQPRLFEWELLKAIYMEESFPAPPNETFLKGIERLADVNQLAIEQLEALRRDPSNSTASAILDRADHVVDQILSFVPELQPLVSWFRVERLRIGPMSVDRLVDTTEAIHVRLSEVLALYRQSSGTPVGETHDDLILE